jgi:hypothetical protein
MKFSISFFVCMMLFSTCVCAQDANIIPPIDKSPMDMSTYPVNFPLLKIQDKTKESITARVTYSRPQKNNRVIFGELVEYNAVWRFGANENTEIEFFKDVKINRILVKKGKYSLFAIPSTDKWTIIINKDLNTWGSFKYDKAKDLLRVDIAVQKVAEIAEVFYIYFDKTNTGFSLNAGWDDVKVTLPINM